MIKIISIRKRGNAYQYCFEAGKVNGKREVYICYSLYAVLIAYKNIQNNLKKQYGKKYKRYILEEVKNK